MIYVIMSFFNYFLCRFLTNQLVSILVPEENQSKRDSKASNKNKSFLSRVQFSGKLSVQKFSDSKMLVRI